MITLKIKRIKRVFNRPPNAIQSLPGLAVQGKRQVGDLCIGSAQLNLVDGHNHLTDMCLDSGKKCKPSNNIARRGQSFLMIRTYRELPNQAHMFPLSLDIGHQVFLLEICRPDPRIILLQIFWRLKGFLLRRRLLPKKFMCLLVE